jgi:hypothetical protein
MSGGDRDRGAGSGSGWLIAWTATCLFAFGAVLLAFAVVTGESGPYGFAAIVALVVCSVGVGALGLAVAIWGVVQLRTPWRSGRRVAALIALSAAVALLTPVVADLVGWLTLPDDTWPLAVGGTTALVLSAILVAPSSEIRPALAFAAIWVLLLATIAYRTWTDLRVEVVWLGPNIANHNPGQVAFAATRSGDFEVRLQAHSCWEGQAVAAGRYTWRPGASGTSFGAPLWVDLPVNYLPLRRGDLVRVCMRDGLAAGTAAGEAGEPPSFWPRN